MAKDFIPGPDAEFDVFFKQLHDAALTDPVGLGLAPTDVTLIKNAYAAWILALPAHQAAQQQAKTASETKASVRLNGEAACRSIAGKINADHAVTNAVRVSVGLAPHDLVKTPIGTPTSRPIGRLVAKAPSTLVLHLADEATPKRSAKPKAVQFCEIFRYVGDTAPSDPSGYALLTQVTKTPHTDAFAVTEAGKTAFYILRWMSPKLQRGPWSTVVSAKIPL